MRSPASLPSHRRLILLALLLSLGIGMLFARAIWTIREDRQQFSRDTSTNLAYVLDQTIARTIEAFDASLQGVVRELSDPEVLALSPALRNRMLFDNSLRASGVGGVAVLDAQGNIVVDSLRVVPRQHNLADRDYFQALQNGSETGLYIGKPVRGVLSGTFTLPLARAYYNDRGRFAGVVVGTLQLSYFNSLFDQLNLGPQSSLTLLRMDGTVIARFPFLEANVGKSLAGSDNMHRMQATRSGVFFGVAALDGVSRQYVFRHIGSYPLVVNVAQSEESMLADWRRSAWWLGSFAALLMIACLALAALFVRELRRRQQMSLQLTQAERDLRTILHNLPAMIAYWDADLRNRFANQAYHAWYGVTAEALAEMSIPQLMDQDSYAQSQPYLALALQGQAQSFERSMVDAQGADRACVVTYTPDVDAGEVRGIFVQVTDITERKRMEQALFEEKERMRLTLQSIGDAVLCTDGLGYVTYLNPVAERMTGWQAFDAAGRHIDEVAPLQVDGDAPASISPLCLALAQKNTLGPTRGAVLQRSDGQRFEVEESASPITDLHGNVTGGVMVLHDISEIAAMAARLAHMAYYDNLTDLPNRALLQDRARQALAQARRSDAGMAVVYLDLDGFKQVNDALGHDAGDLLLAEFARRLRAAVRATDTVSRQGGDEFVVLLAVPADAAQVAVVARKILATCDEPFVLMGTTVRVGVTGGVALYPQHGESFEALSRHADTAMYAAKRSGRGRFCLYTDTNTAPECIAVAVNVAGGASTPELPAH